MNLLHESIHIDPFLVQAINVMPTYHPFVVGKTGNRSKIYKLPSWYRCYKKQMSTVKECTIAHHIDASIGGAFACATDPLLSKDISDKDDDEILGETFNPIGLKSDEGEGRFESSGAVFTYFNEDRNSKPVHSSESTTLSKIPSQLLHLSDGLRFWPSKLIVRDSDQLIDVSSAACRSSSTISISAAQQNFPYSGTEYQFDPMVFHNTAMQIQMISILILISMLQGKSYLH
jgi:hypothetical protein